MVNHAADLIILGLAGLGFRVASIGPQPAKGGIGNRGDIAGDVIGSRFAVDYLADH